MWASDLGAYLELLAPGDAQPLSERLLNAGCVQPLMPIQKPAFFKINTKE